MIKFFKKQDIIITPFTVAKKQTLNSIFGDLILGSDGDDTFPLIGNFFGCNDNVSGSCDLINFENYLSVSQFEDEINFRIGKFISSSSVFYPSGSSNFNIKDNPLNLDGTYQRQIFNTVKKMYYNDYNNAYNIFGFDGFDISKANLQLPNDFSEINLKITQAGDKIRPKSILLNNQTGDVVADIIDDGNHNLILSGTFFINKYKLSSDSFDLTTPLDICGLGGYLYNTTSYEDVNCCPGGDGIGGSPNGPGGTGGPAGSGGPGPGNPSVPPVPPGPPPTPSISVTPSLTPTPPMSVTPEMTVTPSTSITPSLSVTPSISLTVTPSLSITPTISQTVTLSTTITPSITPTISQTITPSTTITPSLTITPSTTPPNEYSCECESGASQIYLDYTSYNALRNTLILNNPGNGDCFCTEDYPTSGGDCLCIPWGGELTNPNLMDINCVWKISNGGVIYDALAWGTTEPQESIACTRCLVQRIGIQPVPVNGSYCKWEFKIAVVGNGCEGLGQGVDPSGGYVIYFKYGPNPYGVYTVDNLQAPPGYSGPEDIIITDTSW